MFAKNMTPLTKGGTRTAHKGKGSQTASMPDRSQIAKLAQPGATINDYAKATPMAQPTPPTMGEGFGG